MARDGMGGSCSTPMRPRDKTAEGELPTSPKTPDALGERATAQGFNVY